MIKTKLFSGVQRRIRTFNNKTYIHEGGYTKKAVAMRAVARLRRNIDIRTRITKSNKMYDVWYYNAEGLRIQRKRGF